MLLLARNKVIDGGFSEYCMIEMWIQLDGENVKYLEQNKLLREISLE